MKSTLRVAGLLVLLAILAATGWRLMGTNFMIHDDEGYVLIGVKNFSEHGRLYDEVFTQYGPAPFLYYDAVHRLTGWPVTNLFGRTLTVMHWLVAAFAAGLIAWRLSQRYWTALFTLAIVFGYLWQMTWEPPHPGGLISLITAVALAAAVEAWHRNRSSLATLILGLAGAALFLTKINVGLFWICSAGAFLLIGTARRGAWLAAALFAVHPGGPRIIDRVQDLLKLTPMQVASSRAVLYENGNMSSATLLFIWKSILENSEIPSGTWVVSLAFGPGLTICGGIFKKV